MQNSAITLSHISKVYANGTIALSDLNLDIGVNLSVW
jgi:ABC-type phosphate/phosphonate transport system ATPase subunit